MADGRHANNELREYTVDLGGFSTTMLLDAAMAAHYGKRATLAAETAPSAKAHTPANKARTTGTK